MTRGVELFARTIEAIVEETGIVLNIITSSLYLAIGISGLLNQVYDCEILHCFISWPPLKVA